MQTTYADKIQIELWVDNNTLKKKTQLVDNLYLGGIFCLIQIR